MKMANIDAVFDFMFTSPKKEDGVRISQTLFIMTSSSRYGRIISY